MAVNNSEKVSSGSENLFLAKVRALAELLKHRLSMLVSLTAIFGYAVAAGREVRFWDLLLVGLGGMLVTGASNVLNQVFEKEHDLVMKRTATRPMPTGRVSTKEALVYAMLLMIAGTSILGSFNLPTALLGIISMLLYAFVYTPMKRISPFCVLVGAIPGALPPLIGWVAFTGSIDNGGLILFAFQFFWQFPHFWAIAWQLDEDYRLAGFRMLPTDEGRGTFSARMILVYAFSLIPLSFFPYQAGMVNVWGMGLLMLLGMMFTWPAFRLFRTMDNRFARQVMFASFIYLPLSQLVLLFT
ncbi:MAG: protoheme IX farnesyltransferase [Bacteroidetes bacterium]|nr:MAG: protoheme IX farnesyltransferase [Bacteroidota bacterium]